MTDDWSSRVDRVSKQLDDVRADYRLEAIKRDRRIRLNQAAVSVALIAALIGILVGVGGIQAQADTNHQTQIARKNSCLQANLQQIRQENAEKAELRALLDAFAPHPTAAQSRIIASALPKYDAAVEKNHPLRDCSPQGIKDYLLKGTP